MTRELIDDSALFLSTLPAQGRERRLAAALALVSLLVFAFLVPFAKIPLAKVPAFIPIYESALVINDLITALLLFGQFGILRHKALLVLAGAYLFTALMAVAHALSFPGLFSPGGLMGAGPQTTVWLYMFWHAVFPLALLAYAAQRRRGKGDIYDGRPLRAVAACMAAVAAAALACVASTTAGHDYLPVLLGPKGFTLTLYLVVSAIWLSSFIALAVLWRARPQTLLDVWLMVVMCTWLADVGLSTLFNAGRFDLGFYFGRIYGWLASAFVLAVLLLENGLLYSKLVLAHMNERKRATELLQMGARLEEANASLAATNEELQKASRLKSEFLANMSHELRTPLNAIIGFSEVLKDGLIGPLSGRQTEFATQIFQSGRHLLELINDILDLSKIEAGKMNLDLEAVKLNESLDACFAVFQGQAQARAIRLTVGQLAEELVIVADRRKLKQMLYNLLSNAIKFTLDGGHVGLTLAPVARGQVSLEQLRGQAKRFLPLPPSEFEEFLEVRVSDTGIGIGAEDMEHLFEAFRQLDTSLSRQREGTGLGLAMVSRLAGLHGGTVGLGSTPGQGSEFVVWLPWRCAEASSPARSAAPQAPGPPVALSNLRKTALVIEDDRRAADLLRLHLESDGFQVVCVLRADEALSEARRLLPDVITLDLCFPESSGWQVLETIKADRHLTDIPVVVVSIIADEHKGLALGAAKILQKPVSRDALLAAVNGLESQRRRERRFHVLVIDDEPQAVELIATSLQSLDCRLDRAYDGQSAVRMVEQTPPDLIILDLLMPGIDGFEVIDMLQRRHSQLLLPILVLTAKSVTRQDRERLHGRVLSIMEKSSFERNDFLTEVKRALHTAGL